MGVRSTLSYAIADVASLHVHPATWVLYGVACYDNVTVEVCEGAPLAGCMAKSDAACANIHLPPRHVTCSDS